MQDIFSPKLTDILPEPLINDKKFFALATALDAELEKLSAQIKLTMHLPRLDELSGAVLDLLAWQFHVDFYEPLGLSDETKRNLIRNSIEVHRLKGTVAAVKKVNEAFNRDVYIQEWFQYGGTPYHFKISTGEFDTNENSAEWQRQLEDAKNVRSWCEGVGVLSNLDIPVCIGTLFQSKVKARFPLAMPARLYVGVAAITYGKTSFVWERDDLDIHLFTATAAFSKGKTSFPFSIRFNMPANIANTAVVGATFGRAKIFPIIPFTFEPKGNIYAATFVQQRLTTHFPSTTTEEDLLFKPDGMPIYAGVMLRLRAQCGTIYNLTSSDEIPRVHTLSISNTSPSTTGGSSINVSYSITDNADKQVSCYKVSGASWITVNNGYITIAPSKTTSGTYSATFGLRYADGLLRSHLTNQVTVNVTVYEYVETVYADRYYSGSTATLIYKNSSVIFRLYENTRRWTSGSYSTSYNYNVNAGGRWFYLKKGGTW